MNIALLCSSLRRISVRAYSSAFFNDSASAQAKVGSLIKKVLLASAFSMFGYLVYVNNVGNKVEVICQQTAANQMFVNGILELKNKLYNKTAYFPFRLLEIIYGNVYDDREFCDYKREIVHDENGENLALGVLIRLASAARSHRLLAR